MSNLKINPRDFQMDNNKPKENPKQKEIKEKFTTFDMWIINSTFIGFMIVFYYIATMGR